MKLSPHFTLEELVQSQTSGRLGIDNSPSEEIIKNLALLASGLETVRGLLNRPILVTSGYRCPALNAAVRGANNSQHMEGLAADILVPSWGGPLQVCEAIRYAQVHFDQLIYEYGWCHISFCWGTPRREVLTLNRATGGYLPGIQPV